MGNYKAKPNNLEDVDSKEIKDAKNEQATEDVLNTAIDVAEHVPGANIYAKGVKLANKLTGGAVTKGASKIVNKGLQSTPIGNQVQGAINQASDSGLTSAVSSASSVKNGGKTSNGASKNFSFLGGSKGKEQGILSGNIIKNLPTPLKIKIYLGLGGAFLLIMFFVIIFADPNDMNLGVTNKENLSFTSNGTRTCTESEIENKLIYVGDKRINSFNDTLNNEKITYITNDSGNLNWLNNLGKSQIESKLRENPDKIVIISVGLNDLGNIAGYIETYRDLITKYPNQVYISSINPVDEAKTNSYNNVDIENFNKSLSDNFPNNYIDTYSTVGSLNTTDGILYDNLLNQSIHSNLLSNLKSSGKVSCSTGLSNIVYYNQNDYKQSYGYGTTIKSDGCGPVAMAMIISTLTGEKVTPVETAKWSLENGYKNSAGTSINFIPAVANHYGIKSEVVSLEQESIINNLTESKPIVMLVGPGIFTSRNHFIILTGISSDGKVSIADPLSRDKSNQLWDINTIIGEGTGSLWAFSI